MYKRRRLPVETPKSSCTLLLSLPGTAVAHKDVDLFCCLFNSGRNGVVHSFPSTEYLSKCPQRPVAEQEIIRLTTKAKMNSAVETVLE